MVNPEVIVINREVIQVRPCDSHILSLNRLNDTQSAAAMSISQLLHCSVYFGYSYLVLSVQSLSMLPNYCHHQLYMHLMMLSVLDIT